jgi:hypothetical protein
LPTQSADTNGKFLGSNGTNAYWAVTSETLPDQQYASGKYLTSNGSTLSWAEVNTAGQTGDITFSNNTISSSSNDVVNIDDNLDVDGTVTGEQFQANGAGTPEINSVSTFNINAPSGVFANSKQVQTYLYNGYITVGDNSTSIGGNDYTAVFNTNADGKYIKVTLADTTLTSSQYFAEATFNANAQTPAVTPTNVIVTKYNNEVYISLRDNAGNLNNPAGVLKLTIYAT